jgi:2,4-dienoyl-CoA reductase-like NADH-dependent reductase (Old Yellow Enzyme family)
MKQIFEETRIGSMALKNRLVLSATYRDLTDMVHQHDSRIVMQIAYGGSKYGFWLTKSIDLGLVGHQIAGKNLITRVCFYI